MEEVTKICQRFHEMGKETPLPAPAGLMRWAFRRRRLGGLR